jgi:hypothetical protein
MYRDVRPNRAGLHADCDTNRNTLVREHRNMAWAPSPSARAMPTNDLTWRAGADGMVTRALTGQVTEGMTEHYSTVGFDRSGRRWLGSSAWFPSPNPGRPRAGQLEHAFLGSEMDTAHRSARPGMRREVPGDAAVLDDLSTTRRT